MSTFWNGNHAITGLMDTHVTSITKNNFISFLAIRLGDERRQRETRETRETQREMNANRSELTITHD